jgi:hypothetical protein
MRGNHEGHASAWDEVRADRPDALSFAAFGLAPFSDPARD